MNEPQKIAITNHCRLGTETAQEKFGRQVFGQPASLVLTVNSGYE